MITYHPLTIADVRPEGSEAVCVALDVPDELREAFRFAPGQHLGVRATIDGQEVRRTYSICSATDEPQLRIGVRGAHVGLCAPGAPSDQRIRTRQPGVGAGMYVFKDEWDVRAPIEDVFAALSDSRTYPEWWTPTYVGVTAEPGVGLGG